MPKSISLGAWLCLARRLLAACLVLAVLATVPASAAGKLTISNWDGYMPDDLLDRFKQATGIEAELTLQSTNEEIMERVTAAGGKGYDVIFIAAPFAQVLKQKELLAELDHQKLPNLKNLYPEASRLKHDPGNRFSIPYAWGTTGLCYRADQLKDPPTSWNDLLKPKPELARKITLLSDARWRFAAALKAEGFSVNETAPDRIKAAAKRLGEAREWVLAYDDAAAYSALVSGDVLLAHAWDSYCNFGTAKNPAIRYALPKEGTDLWVDVVVISQASENKDAAHAFLNFLLEPHIAEWLAKELLYKSPNQAGMARVDKHWLEKFPNLSLSPQTLLKQEQMLDIGEDARKDYERALADVMKAK
ncbi:polyamine ABC transporter substrate-binding protein [Rhodoligotrophos ferricapiens]|uniref:polyamine ABC transporter substrate-binding protein n=1 Tax=Rhodoligotrophos ferricapiens TaxID=3069264 RepID=UPI00315C5F3F